VPSRNITNRVLAGKRFTTYPNDVPAPEYYSETIDTRELVWGGGGHYGYPNFPDNKDVGGDFMVVYKTIKSGAVNVGTIQGGHVFQEYRYSGNVWVTPNPSENMYSYQSTGSTLGATAYARMKPDRPAMNALNSIYELKDVPGQLKQAFQAKDLDKVEDWYLAQKFGWDALFKDVASFIVTQRKAQEILKQFIRDEGKPVRRRIMLSDSNTENWTDHGSGGSFMGPSFVSYFYGPGSYSVRGSLVDRTWSSAEFKYWLPSGPRDVGWTNDMLRKIYGLKATPAVVYRAIPWSWLASWFTNVGDMIENLETNIVDRLAASHFYVMRTREQVYEQTGTQTFWKAETLEPITVTATGTARIGCKSRVRGDPFGFGTPENSLNGVQLSILGALGLSRLR